MTSNDNGHRGPPRGGSACGWVLQDVDHWILCRIRGEEWSQGPLPEHPTIIRKKDLLVKVSLSDVTLWHLEQRGKFPRRFKLTDKPWIQARVAPASVAPAPNGPMRRRAPPPND